MRIAWVAYDGPGCLNGPTVNARRLLPELKRRGHEPHALILTFGPSPLRRFLEAKGVACHVLPWKRYTSIHVRWMLERLRAIEPDVFVPNSSVPGYFAARWAREAGVPSIAVHRSDDAFHAAMVEQFVLGPPEWAMSGLVCVSETARLEVQQRLQLQPAARSGSRPKTRLCTIPSGVEVPPWSAAQDDGPLRFAYVGRLEQEQKRALDVAAALAAALQVLPGATATLFGDGPQRGAIAELIEARGLQGRMQLAGSVAPEAIQDRLRAQHVIVLLSDYEGTPGALMDGMACGLVPLCLDIPGGVRQLVTPETGLLVSGRGTEFVEAAQSLQDASLRRRLGQAARARIMEHYSLPIAASRWGEFGRVLLQDAAPRRALEVPHPLELPPVAAHLAREDFRIPPWPQLPADWLGWKAQQIRPILGSWKRFLRRAMRRARAMQQARDNAETQAQTEW